MQVQDVVTVSIFVFFVSGAVVFGLLSTFDVEGKIEQKAKEYYGKHLNWEFCHPKIDNDFYVYKVYGVDPPANPISSVIRKQKYIKNMLTSKLHSLKVNVDLFDFTRFLLKINDNYWHYDNRDYDYYHINSRRLLSIENAVFFMVNNYDEEKVKKLYRRGLTFEQIVESYDMPLEWVDRLYNVTLQEARPISRF